MGCADAPSSARRSRQSHDRSAFIWNQAKTGPWNLKSDNPAELSARNSHDFLHSCLLVDVPFITVSTAMLSRIRNISRSQLRDLLKGDHATLPISGLISPGAARFPALRSGSNTTIRSIPVIATARRHDDHLDSRCKGHEPWTAHLSVQRRIQGSDLARRAGLRAP